MAHEEFERDRLLADFLDRLHAEVEHHGAAVEVAHREVLALAAEGPAFVDDGGNFAEVLAARTDAGDAHILILQLIFNDLLGVCGFHAPQFFCTF